MRTISLKSKHLKVGDTIIRAKELTEYGKANDYSYTTMPITIVKKTPTHIQFKQEWDYLNILPIEKWDDGNWVRF